MMTVEPANTTAPPEVAVARAIDSRTSMPVAQLVAVARDDEQAVVDADAEADHRRERRRRRRHVDHLPEQGVSTLRPHAEAEDRRR